MSNTNESVNGLNNSATAQGVAAPMGPVGNGAVQGVATPVYPVGNGSAPNWGYQSGVSNSSNAHEAGDAAGNKLMLVPVGNTGNRLACPVPTIPELKVILKFIPNNESNYIIVSAALGFVYERNKDLLPLLFNWLENQLCEQRAWR